MKKRIVMMALISAMVAAVGIFIIRGIPAVDDKTSQAMKPSKKVPVVDVAVAGQSAVARRLALSGTVEAYRMARLASPAEGPVENMNVREGDRVEAGGKLVLIGRRQGADALITYLREELKKEEENLRRIRQLLKTSVIAEEALDKAMADVEKARSQLVQAEESAGDHTIAAPWDGVVSNVAVKEGEFVAPRTVLIEIYDPDSLVIRAAVPERYAAEIRPAMRVDIRMDALPDKLVQGSIQRIYPYLDDRMRTRTVEIVPDGPVVLLPGMFARLQIVLEKQDNAVVVPKEAVFSTTEGKAVFVVEAQKAVKRLLKTGIEEKGRIQVVEGVLAGDRVIVAGHRRIKHGDAVRFEKGRPQ